MARPQKQGLDYFPLDTVFDTNMELIEAEFGLTGFAVVVKLWQKIYAEHGYYCEWTDEVALLFAKRNNVGGNAVSEIITASIKRGIFDKDLYDKYHILTSAGIQKRYFEAVNRRIQINAKAEYLLVSYTQNAENVNINLINADRNNKNVNINSQSKIDKKDIKIYENITNNNITDESNNTDFFTIKQSYETNIGFLTPKVAEKLLAWLDDVDVSLIIYAIEKAVEYGAKKPSYIYGIIQNQFNLGHTTAKQAVDAQKLNHSKAREKAFKKNAFQDYGSDGYEQEMEIMKKQMQEELS